LRPPDSIISGLKFPYCFYKLDLDLLNGSTFEPIIWENSFLSQMSGDFNQYYAKNHIERLIVGHINFSYSLSENLL